VGLVIVFEFKRLNSYPQFFGEQLRVQTGEIFKAEGKKVRDSHPQKSLLN
jgi:hypothetical protein